MHTDARVGSIELTEARARGIAKTHTRAQSRTRQVARAATDAEARRHTRATAPIAKAARAVRQSAQDDAEAEAAATAAAQAAAAAASAAAADAQQQQEDTVTCVEPDCEHAAVGGFLRPIGPFCEQHRPTVGQDYWTQEMQDEEAALNAESPKTAPDSDTNVSKRKADAALVPATKAAAPAAPSPRPRARRARTTASVLLPTEPTSADITVAVHLITNNCVINIKLHNCATIADLRHGIWNSRIALDDECPAIDRMHLECDGVRMYPNETLEDHFVFDHDKIHLSHLPDGVSELMIPLPPSDRFETAAESYTLRPDAMVPGSQVPEYKAQLWRRARVMLEKHTCYIYTVINSGRNRIEQTLADNYPMDIHAFRILRKTGSNATGEITHDYLTALIAGLQHRLEFPDEFLDQSPILQQARAGTLAEHTSEYTEALLAAEGSITTEPDRLRDAELKAKGVYRGLSARFIATEWSAFAQLLADDNMLGALRVNTGTEGNPHPSPDSCITFSTEFRENAFLAPKRSTTIKFPLRSKYAGIVGDWWAPTSGTMLCMNEAYNSFEAAHARAHNRWVRMHSMQQGHEFLRPKKWECHAIDAMTLVYFGNFEQNHELCQLLLQTAQDGKWPVCAGAHKVWGIGSTFKSPFTQADWRGDNVLGDVIAFVRTSLAIHCPDPLMQLALSALWSKNWPAFESLPALQKRGHDADRICTCPPGDKDCTYHKRQKNLAGPMTSDSYCFEAVACEAAGVQGRSCCNSKYTHQHLAAIRSFVHTPLDNRLCLCRKLDCLSVARRQAAALGDDSLLPLEDIQLLATHEDTRPHCLAPLSDTQEAGINTWKPKPVLIIDLAALENRSTQLDQAAGGPAQAEAAAKLPLEALPSCKRKFLPHHQVMLDKEVALKAFRTPKAIDSALQPSSQQLDQRSAKALVASTPSALSVTKGIPGSALDKMTAADAPVDTTEKQAEFNLSSIFRTDSSDESEEAQDGHLHQDEELDAAAQYWDCGCGADQEKDCVCPVQPLNADGRTEQQLVDEQRAKINALLPPDKQVTEGHVRRIRQRTGVAMQPAEEKAEVITSDRLYTSSLGRYTHCKLQPDTIETRDRPLVNILFPACGKWMRTHISRVKPWVLALLHEHHNIDPSALINAEDLAPRTEQEHRDEARTISDTKVCTSLAKMMLRVSAVDENFGALAVIPADFERELRRNPLFSPAFTAERVMRNTMFALYIRDSVNDLNPDNIGDDGTFGLFLIGSWTALSEEQRLPYVKLAAISRHATVAARSHLAKVKQEAAAPATIAAAPAATSAQQEQPRTQAPAPTAKDAAAEPSSGGSANGAESDIAQRLRRGLDLAATEQAACAQAAIDVAELAATTIALEKPPSHVRGQRISQALYAGIEGYWSKAWIHWHVTHLDGDRLSDHEVAFTQGGMASNADSFFRTSRSNMIMFSQTLFCKKHDRSSPPKYPGTAGHTDRREKAAAKKLFPCPAPQYNPDTYHETHSTSNELMAVNSGGPRCRVPPHTHTARARSTPTQHAHVASSNKS